MTQATGTTRKALVGFYKPRLGDKSRIEITEVSVDGMCRVHFVDIDRDPTWFSSELIAERYDYLSTYVTAAHQAAREHEEKYPSTRFTPEESLAIRQIVGRMRFMGGVGNPVAGLENVTDLLDYLRAMSERLVWLSEDNERKDATLAEHAHAIEGARAFARLVGLPLVEDKD
jgi:hypothetical protein